MKKTVVALALFRLALATPVEASAQEPTFTPHPLQPLAALPPLAQAFPSLLGEPTGSAGSLSAYMTSAPLRLSLQSGIFPMAGALAQCQTLEEASGNSVGGVPLLRYTSLQLAPNLVLHGFSTAGCPVDAGIGGAATYTVPVGPALWLVAGAGVYSTPAFPSRAQGDVRLDLIKKADDSHSFSVGLGRRGVTFGGAF